MKLKSAQKKFFNGTHRLASPQETRINILSRIAAAPMPYEKIIRIDGESGRLPVYAVLHRSQAGERLLPSWGKGVTPELAFVSALMERIERYTASAIDTRKHELIFGTCHSLQKMNALSLWKLVPSNLLRVSQTKNETNNQRMPWIRCFSLSDQKDVLMPAHRVFFNSGYGQNDFSYTSGLASGNTLEEAVAHALCETIEHHFEDTIHWNKIKIPTVPKNSIMDPALKDLIRLIETTENVRLCISYLSQGHDLPVFRVFGIPESPPYPDSFGFYISVGVHPDKNIALSRALTEFVQGRISGEYRNTHGYDHIEYVPAFPKKIFSFYQNIIDLKKTVSFDSIPSHCYEDILDDIKLASKTIHQLGGKVIIKDLTHPRLGIPTVRVFALGLQPAILGVSITRLSHKAACISRHLTDYDEVTKILDRNLFEE